MRRTAIANTTSSSPSASIDETSDAIVGSAVGLARPIAAQLAAVERAKWQRIKRIGSSTGTSESKTESFGLVPPVPRREDSWCLSRTGLVAATTAVSNGPICWARAARARRERGAGELVERAHELRDRVELHARDDLKVLERLDQAQRLRGAAVVHTTHASSSSGQNIAPEPRRHHRSGQMRPCVMLW